METTDRIGDSVKKFRSVPILLTLFICLSCTRSPTPFDRFRGALEQIAGQAEAQRLDLLEGILHADFCDQDDRDREMVVDWLNGLLKTHRDVVVNLLDIELVSSPTLQTDGEVRVDLVVSSGSLKFVRQLVPYYGQLVRMQLFVTGEEVWLITAARWQRIDVVDLGVQAMDRFKALFPAAGKKDQL